MAINLNDLQELLAKAETNSTNDKEIRKSLGRLETLLATVGEEITKVYAILDGATPVKKARRTSEADPDAPFGRKADGTPKKRPGRVKASATA